MPMKMIRWGRPLTGRLSLSTTGWSRSAMCPSLLFNYSTKFVFVCVCSCMQCLVKFNKDLVCSGGTDLCLWDGKGCLVAKFDRRSLEETSMWVWYVWKRRGVVRVVGVVTCGARSGVHEALAQCPTPLGPFYFICLLCIVPDEQSLIISCFVYSVLLTNFTHSWILLESVGLAMVSFKCLMGFLWNCWL